MFESEDEVSKFGSAAMSHTPYLQRSASAPAMAEHVSEGQMPSYGYENSQLEVDPIYYNNGPSRNNSRLPLHKRQGESDNIGGLLEESEKGGENKSILASLIADKSLRTPIDLIQEDFPATPSSVFSSQARLFGGAAVPGEPRFEPDLDKLDESFKEDSILSNSRAGKGGAAPRSAVTSAQVDSSLDQAMQQLYVGDDDLSGGRAGSLVSHMAGNSPQPHVHHVGAGGLQSLGIRSNHAGQGANRGSLPGQYSELALPHGEHHHHPNEHRQHFRMQQQHNPPLPPGSAPQQQQQQQQLFQQQMYMQSGEANLPNGGPNHPGQGPNPNQPPMPPTTYYLQQPVYVDQHGQPVYYRVGPGGQFQQDVMYGNSGDGPSGEQVLPPYMQFAQGQQIPGQPGFWPQGQMDPQGGPGGAMFLGPGGQQVDGPMRRVMYNQVGPYNMSLVPGNGGPMGSRPGAPYSLGAPGGMMMRPPEMDMYRPLDRSKSYGRYDHEKRDYRNDRSGRNGRDYNRNNNNSNSSSINPMRDPLVDDFRSTYGKTRTWELVDLLGHVVAFCQDQHGSRFIQQRLEVCSEVDKQLIFDEIIGSAHSLMTDVFGNYVLQKLFEYGTPDQCETLAVLLSGQAVQLSMQMYGCRVVQKALEYVSTQRLIILVSEFENPQVLLRCVHDSNGNHVIQKCIEVVSRVAKEATTPELSEYLSSRIMFIINAFQGRVKELSSHPYGCRVVQRILEHCSNPQKAVILEELRQCCSDLVQDCYGNYVIQFVMQHGWEADRAVLIKEVQAHLLEFSQHKFASNVVEKCLQYASKRDRDDMIWTIINVTFDLNNPVDAKTGHCVLESMVRDPYANYVVQKVIEVADERQRAAIMRYVRENIIQLRRYTYGKHIIVRLEKITNEKF